MKEYQEKNEALSEKVKELENKLAHLQSNGTNLFLGNAYHNISYE